MSWGYNNTTDVPIYGVFVQGTNHQLWLLDFGEAGSAWGHLTACPEALSASSPAVVFSFDGHTEVWVSTTSGNLMYCFATGNWPPVNTWEWVSATSPPLSEQRTGQGETTESEQSGSVFFIFEYL